MKPTLIKSPAMTDREAAYRAALTLVGKIDDDLDRGTGHYRNRAGVLLETLPEVVNAILADNLAVNAPERLAV